MSTAVCMAVFPQHNPCMSLSSLHTVRSDHGRDAVGVARRTNNDRIHRRHGSRGRDHRHAGTHLHCALLHASVRMKFMLRHSSTTSIALTSLTCARVAAQGKLVAPSTAACQAEEERQAKVERIFLHVCMRACIANSSAGRGLHTLAKFRTIK